MVRYLVIGAGRAAQNFVCYFKLLGLQFEQWNRHETTQKLKVQLQTATHVLLLISDRAISEFHQTHLSNYPGQTLHFSGALEVPGVISVHPLMTFTDRLFSLEDYKKIPFVTTSQEDFSKLLPGLPNPSFYLNPEKKAYYHALCVLSGNFTTLLWQKMNEGLRELGLPEGIQIPYMEQIFKNLKDNPGAALTGPLMRKDLQTVLANDRALSQDSSREIYRAFVHTYFPEAFSQLEGAK
ncbi:MAG: DUF2520 domain-containing protein [Pseudobdellovibrionaceae bacterium]